MLSFVFALWFSDVSFFAARAEFRCLISLGESVPSASSCGSFASQLGRLSPIVNMFHCSMNKHVQPSMNKHELRLTPARLPTCCSLATFPLSDVIQTSFELLPGNSTDTFNVSLEFMRLSSGPTNLFNLASRGINLSLYDIATRIPYRTMLYTLMTNDLASATA